MKTYEVQGEEIQPAVHSMCIILNPLDALVLGLRYCNVAKECYLNEFGYSLSHRILFLVNLVVHPLCYDQL